MSRFLQKVIFVLKMAFLFFSEWLLYCIKGDFDLFIDRLTLRLASINILYVKLFQAFALNNHLIDDRINARLIRFTDSAPWTHDDIDLDELQEMADKNGIELQSRCPINSGMISLVFKGTRTKTTDFSEGVEGSERTKTTDFSEGVEGSERTKTTDFSEGVEGSERTKTTDFSEGVAGSERTKTTDFSEGVEGSERTKTTDFSEGVAGSTVSAKKLEGVEGSSSEIKRSNSDSSSFPRASEKFSSSSFLVIKIKRKNIDETLAKAIDDVLEILQTVDYWFSWLQLEPLIKKHVSLIMSQLDFEQELQNMEKMRKACAHMKYVVIPKSFPEITVKYPNMIVMECIQGQKIGDIKDVQSIDEFAKLIVKFGIATTFVHGVAHGDLHGGNILFIKSIVAPYYRLGILDFGIVYEVDEAFKTTVFDLMVELMVPPDDKCAESASSASLERNIIIKLLDSPAIVQPPNIMRQLPTKEYEKIIDAATAVLIDARKHNMNQTQIFQFMAMLKDLLSSDNQYGIRPSDELVKSQLVLAMAHGTTMTLAKERMANILEQVIGDMFRLTS